jgi:hypothetical protein
MTVVEIKTEIQKALDSMPEDALVDILSYIKNFRSQSITDLRTDQDIQAILNENHGLLKRLAQ